MIDLHTHTLLSDGELLPSELVQRAVVCGYRAIAITDHVDQSNMERILGEIIRFTEECKRDDIDVIAGVELTHIPPRYIPSMVERARRLGAGIVVGHGETLSEPVEKGTNMAFIDAGVDVLAHPGLVTPEECRLACERSVFFEITTRPTHALANGHVARMAERFGVKVVINTDTHGPSDLVTRSTAEKVLRGAGIEGETIKRIDSHAEEIINRVLVQGR